MTDALEPEVLPGESPVAPDYEDAAFVYTVFPDTPVSLPGRVRVTNYRVAFYRAAAAAALWALPLATLGAVDKEPHAPADTAWRVRLTCKTLAVATLAFATRAARRAFVAALRTAAFVQPARERLFAFTSTDTSTSASVSATSASASAGFLYDPVREFVRQGALAPGGAPTSTWRATTLNASYALCASYPRVLVVPAAAPDTLVQEAAAFRTRGRVAVLTWLSREGVPLARSSQPRCGVGGARCASDAALLALYRTANPADQGALLVADSRPRSAALANRARGGGAEDPRAYAHCRVSYAGIANIHAVRAAYTRVRALAQPNSDPSRALSALEASRWPAHAATVLRGAAEVVAAIALRRQAVLCHCSDGWDRTAQCCALAELCLDGHYRTLRGLATLLAKDWLAFGHKFAQRGAHGCATPGDQCAPVFAQFLYCARALLAQYPAAFEYSARLLAFFDAHALSGRFAEFLADTDAQREADRAAHPHAPSVWDAVLAHRSAFLNPRYDPASEHDVLFPDADPRAIPLWEDHYLAWLRVHPNPSDPADEARRAARERDLTRYEQAHETIIHALHRDVVLPTVSSENDGDEEDETQVLSSPSASPEGSSRKKHQRKEKTRTTKDKGSKGEKGDKKTKDGKGSKSAKSKTHKSDKKKR